MSTDTISIMFVYLRKQKWMVAAQLGKADADDVIQSACIECWREICKANVEIRHPMAFARAVLQRKIFRFIQYRKRDREVFDRSINVDYDESAVEHPDYCLDADPGGVKYDRRIAVQSRHVRAVVARLQPKNSTEEIGCQIISGLLLGLSRPELRARVAGGDENTYRNALHRTLKKVKLEIGTVVL